MAYPSETYVDEPRRAEAGMLANMLDSCDVDSEVCAIGPLTERQGQECPGFRSDMRDRAVVRVEIAPFADALVRAYMGIFASRFL
jgi:hypothetical protein